MVALNVRSAGRADQPLPGEEAEMDYPTVLNRALPADIRITGWAAVPEDFSARWAAEGVRGGSRSGKVGGVQQGVR